MSKTSRVTITLTALVVLILTVEGCTQTGMNFAKLPALPEDAPVGRFLNEKLGFYFYYPKEWTLPELTREAVEGKTVLLSPFTNEEVSQLSLHVAVRTDLGHGLEEDGEFLASARKHYQQSGQTILELQRAEAKKIYPALESKVTQKKGDFTYITKQVAFFAGSRFFVISMYGRDDLFATMESVFNEFFEYFTIRQ